MIAVMLWVVIMIMVTLFRAFQILLGLPELNEFTALINKCSWITMGIQYTIVAGWFVQEYRKYK